MDASSKMPDGHMDSIEPYDYKELKPFSTAYLPGFLADKFDVTVEQSRAAADQRCEGTLASALRGTVKRYDLCVLRDSSVHLRRGKVHYALMPRLDAEYQVAWEGLPLCHEWTDRKAGGRPAGQLGEVLGAVCRHRRPLI